MKLAKILPHLNYQFKTEHELISSIEELSRNFTTNRQDLADYLKDERLSAAYTAFYLTTNIPKLQHLFELLPSEFLSLIKDTAFLDVGAGPGTFSIAFREWVNRPINKLIQIETSEVMRNQSRKLWQGLYPGESSLWWERVQTDESVGKLMLFGHSANEMGPEKTLDYIQKINPEHVLFIEPGTKDFFPQMLSIRQKLILQGYQVIYPCPNAEECPLKNSSQDWCHQFLQVTQDPEVERLSQMVKKDRRNLPVIFHAYSRTFKSKNPDYRLVRVLPETKFSFEWEVCHQNVLERVQVMKREMSKTEEKAMAQVLAGTGLELEVVKELEQSKRVKVTKIMN
jgi:ribosomal protein RSM22 (predicted rRNA methylase)